MISAIRELKKDTSGFFFITGICILFIIILSWLLTVIIWLTTNKKNIKVLSVIISIIITLSCIGWIYYDIISYRNQIEYELQILTNETGEYTLYVPYLDNTKLKSVLKVHSGEGNIGFVDINKTPILSSNNALQIISSGNVTINGKTQDQSSPEMTLLSRMIEWQGEYWIWCNGTNGNQSIMINISAYYSSWNGMTNWWTGSLDNPGYQHLIDGWNIVTIYEETFIVG